MHDIRDPRPAQTLQCLDQLVRLVEFLHIVSAADALALHEDIRDCAAAGHLGESVLQLCAQRVLVQFYDVGSGRDGVFVEEDVFCALGEGAVGFGEDDDCCSC